MKAKRLLSILLALVMVLCTVPATVFAADGDVAIDETNFPDATFRAHVKENFDTDNNELLSTAEIAAVTRIDVSNQNITSLKGVEYFTDLELLYCYDNQLTSLDVSNNTALKELFCHNNQLATLDVSANTALTMFVCSGNQLTSLDVSVNTAITYLYCSANQLTSLNVSANTALTSLYCFNNQLTTLDVSGAKYLTTLDCYYNQLTTLDVSNNTKLDYLGCDNNQLTSLDVSNNTALTRLGCYNNQLASLDVSNNTTLTSLDCSNNQLTSLDVSNNTALTYLYCFNNQLTSLDVSGATALTWLWCFNNEYTITLGEGRTFDLTTLPGNFDVSRASAWNGGTVGENILTVDGGVTEVTYAYDVGMDKSEVFKLHVVISDTPIQPHEHSYDVTAIKHPTCTAEGYVEYTCEYCDDSYREVIPALGHIVRVVNESAVYTGDIVCKRCGEILEKGKYRPLIAYPIIPSRPINPVKPGDDKPVVDEPVEEELPFADVAKDAPYYDAVAYLCEAGIMNGTGDTTFSPDYTLNRATVVAMLYRLEGEPEVVADATFTDVEVDEWYTDAVLWAASVGIVEGYGDGTFGPKKNVTNEQLAAIIRRYAEYKGVTIAETTELPADAIVSDWAVGNVAWAAATGILDEVQTHAATANATRAQVAASIYNYIVNLVK